MLPPVKSHVTSQEFVFCCFTCFKYFAVYRLRAVRLKVVSSGKYLRAATDLMQSTDVWMSHQHVQGQRERCERSRQIGGKRNLFHFIRALWNYGTYKKSRNHNPMRREGNNVQCDVNVTSAFFWWLLKIDEEDNATHYQNQKVAVVVVAAAASFSG